MRLAQKETLSMTYLRSVIFVLAVLTSSAFAEPPTDNKASEFLEVGNDYFLFFGSGDNPFSISHTAPNSTGKTKEGIAYGPMTINYSVRVFSVIEERGGSWVLVEHPADVKKSFEWNAKRLAIAALNEKTVTRFQASEEGRKKLEELRKEAGEKIETARTWINLGHVVAIQPLPSTPQDAEVSITYTPN